MNEDFRVLAVVYLADHFVKAKTISNLTEVEASICLFLQTNSVCNPNSNYFYPMFPVHIHSDVCKLLQVNRQVHNSI